MDNVTRPPAGAPRPAGTGERGPVCTCPPITARWPHQAACPRGNLVGDRRASIADRQACRTLPTVTATPREWAALDRLLHAHIDRDDPDDPGMGDLRRLRERLRFVTQDHSAYTAAVLP